MVSIAHSADANALETPGMPEQDTLLPSPAFETIR